jgi:hypothetical protein
MTTLATARTRAAGVLAAITMTAVVAACSADDGTADASGGSSAGTSDSRELGAADAEAPADAGSDAASSDSGTASGASSRTPAMERKLISSGTVSLQSGSVAEARREVQRVVDAQGGDITEESTESDERGATSYVRLVVRVDSAKFSATMEALEGVATLRQSSRGSEDVSTQVIDTGVRVRAQEASLKRVERLLAEARTLKDIIWIESQLTTRQAELDSLKSQATWLDDQTSQATITVDISRAAGKADEPEDDEPAGFLAGLRGGMKALGASFATLATIAGALLPFAVVLGVLGLPVWLLVRRRRTVTQPAAPEA